MNLNLTEVLETMGRYLLALGVGDNEETTIEARVCGQVMRVRVIDSEGEVALSVVGADSEEVGAQLALACLQNLSIEHLGALHMEPLNGVLQVLPRKK